jgi:hypothetical protein
MEYPGSWDKNLPWVEFSYNNNYQESMKMALLKFYMNIIAVHRSIRLSQEGKSYLVLNIINEAKATAQRIQDNLKAVKSHQESYAN